MTTKDNTETNFIEILRQDHNEIITASNQLLATDDFEEIFSLFKKLYKNLEIHSKIEEEIFYPLLRAEYPEIVLNSYEEHKTLKNNLNEIYVMNESQEYADLWISKIKVAMEIFKRHADEEEIQIFPKVKEMYSDDELKTIGTQALEYKDRLDITVELE